jgi:hypothetical protein
LEVGWEEFWEEFWMLCDGVFERFGGDVGWRVGDEFGEVFGWGVFGEVAACG